jgi:hypothetical protein
LQVQFPGPGARKSVDKCSLALDLEYVGRAQYAEKDSDSITDGGYKCETLSGVSGINHVTAEARFVNPTPLHNFALSGILPWVGGDKLAV